MGVSGSNVTRPRESRVSTRSPRQCDPTQTDVLLPHLLFVSASGSDRFHVNATSWYCVTLLKSRTFATWVISKTSRKPLAGQFNKLMNTLKNYYNCYDLEYNVLHGIVVLINLMNTQFFCLCILIEGKFLPRPEQQIKSKVSPINSLIHHDYIYSTSQAEMFYEYSSKVKWETETKNSVFSIQLLYPTVLKP